MNKNDYKIIARAIAQFDHDNGTHSHGLCTYIQEELAHAGEKNSFERCNEMRDAYDSEREKLIEAEKSPIQRARERQQIEALA